MSKNFSMTSSVYDNLIMFFQSAFSAVKDNICIQRFAIHQNRNLFDTYNRLKIVRKQNMTWLY